MELNDQDDSRPTPRTMLGRRLRRLREGLNYSQRALAEEVGYPHTYISRVERGEQLPSEALTSALDRYFGTDELFAELLELAQDTSIPDYGRAAVSKEADAERIQVFTSSLIPGLLQSEEYARELFRKSLPGESDDKVNERVAVRMHRKRIFERLEPPYFWAIIDEAALKRPVGSKKQMSEQLDHLLEIAVKPHFTLQILPFADGAHPMMGGCLTMLTLRDGGSMAFVESFASGETVELPKRVIELTQRFDVARAIALSGEKSLDLIREYLREYKNEDDS